LKQIKSTNIIYLHGGLSIKIIDTLKKFPHLENYFNGKIIAGESARANALSHDCYSNITKIHSKGLGIIPVRTICHYHQGDEKVLQDNNPNLKLLLLPKYKYKVFYK